MAAIVAQAEAAAAEIDIDEASTRTLDRCATPRPWLGSRYPDHALQRRNQAGKGPQHGHCGVADQERSGGLRACSSGHGVSAWSRRSAATRTSRLTSIRRSAMRADFVSKAAPSRSASRGPISANERFFVPFVFSANGRPYLKQVETESGIWFRDARKAVQSSPRACRLADAGRPEGHAGNRRGGRPGGPEGSGPSISGSRSAPIRSAPSRKLKTELGARPPEHAARHGDRHRQDEARDRDALPASGGEALPPGVLSSWTATRSAPRPPASSRPPGS